MGSTPTFGTIRYNGKKYLGAWLSLVERSVRVAEVGGSNPLAPTKPSDREAVHRFPIFLLRARCCIRLVLPNRNARSAPPAWASRYCDVGAALTLCYTIFNPRCSCAARHPRGAIPCD